MFTSRDFNMLHHNYNSLKFQYKELCICKFITDVQTSTMNSNERNPTLRAKARNGPIRQFMVVDLTHLKQSHPSLSVGSIVTENVSPKGVRQREDKIYVKGASCDKKSGDEVSGILCPKLCLKQLDDVELELFSAIQRNERCFTLEKFNKNHLSLEGKPEVGVIHPVSKKKVFGKVVDEASRPDRLGTWWRIELDKVMISLCLL